MFHCICYLVAFTLVVSSATAAANAQQPNPSTNSLGMKFQRIEAGEYDRGHNHSGQCEELVVAFPRSISPRGFASEESPRHRVRISRPFDMGAHEVTRGQFARFVRETEYRTTCERSGKGAVGFAPISTEERARTGRHRPFRQAAEYTWRRPGFEQTDEHPVVAVSWEDAQAFCRWLSEKEGARYRLPTEAEWEYACRAGATTWFSFGDTFREKIHRHANVANVELDRKQPGLATSQWLLDVDREPSDGHAFTAPVGSYRPNTWGLYDLHGNVWEWCQDRYLDTSYRSLTKEFGKQPAVDPLNTQAGDQHGQWRVIRGGSWCNGPILCRSATRGFFDAPQAACYLGFRVVREVAERSP